MQPFVNCLAIFFLLICLFFLVNESINTRRKFSLFFSQDFVIFSINMDVLKNKTLLPKFEEVITIALQHFPELQNIKIQFIQKKWFHFTVASLIDRRSLFGPRAKRSYTIIINTQVPTEFDHVLFTNLPQQLQI